MDRMLVIELDGSQHAESVAADSQRTAFLERAGFLVLRFWNNQVFEEMDGVLEAIWQALRTRQANPSPPSAARSAYGRLPLKGREISHREIDVPANSPMCAR